MAAPDPHRRQDLLAHILDHLRAHPLQSVTFRGLADALGESTFVLVYHFGSKERLLEAAMDAIDHRQAEMVEGDPGGSGPTSCASGRPERGAGASPT